MNPKLIIASCIFMSITKGLNYDAFTSESKLRNSISNTILKKAVLNISYDGRNFHGWSAANDVRSVEGSIKKCLSRLYSNADVRNINIDGCSRTDKGVNSKSLIARFECVNPDGTLYPLPFQGNLSKIKFVLNRMLKPDVRINAICVFPNDKFHPSLDATVKTYQYSFSAGNIHDPLLWRYVWHVKKGGKFNITLAEDCCRIFLGVHNFSAFRGASRGSDRKDTEKVNPTCNITHLTIHSDQSYYMSDVSSFSDRPSFNTFSVTVTGTRFLYKMVRFIVGALVAVGFGKLKIHDVNQALKSGKRNENVSRHVVCAPPHGLTLVDVQYGNDVQFQWIN